MGAWEAVIAGVISAGSAYVSSKAAKKQAEGVHDQWEDRMRYEEEKLARKRNSMGAKMAPYLMEQMLRVYGDQSKGRGGFTLPIDEILSNMNIKGRQSGTYNSSNGGMEQLSPGISVVQRSEMNQARKNGDRSYSLNKVDPEIDGYNGKVWTGIRGSAELEGAPSAGGFGVSARDVGGPRESTRGMGNTKTQTERGYTTVTQPLGPGSVMTSTEQIPNIEGELATGGTGLFASRDVPPELIKKFGLAALKVGMSVFVPGLGTVVNVAGKIKQKTGKSDGKQSFWESFAGINDADYGRLTKSDSFIGKLLDKMNSNKPGQSPQTNPISVYGPDFR